MQETLKLEASALLRSSEGLLRSPHLSESVLCNFFHPYTIRDKKSDRPSLFFCGVGKSGLVGKKIAATFSSIGVRSFFLHPTEAMHGDLGNLSAHDGIVFISKSGTTDEIMKLIPFLPIARERRLGLLGNLNSPIASKCALVLDCSVEKEACINNLAPTTSTTLAMAMGDALAVAYEKYCDLSTEDFGRNHPAGLLGKVLRLKVCDLMIPRKDCPTVFTDSPAVDLLLKMTEKPVGLGAIIEKETGELQGIVVDGDLRRYLSSFLAQKKDGLTAESPVSVLANRRFTNILPDDLAIRAFELMEHRRHEISCLPVSSSSGEFLGVIRLHDLIKEGFV